MNEFQMNLFSVKIVTINKLQLTNDNYIKQAELGGGTYIKSCQTARSQSAHFKEMS